MADGPTFTNPPVAEIVLGVQHEPLAGLRPPIVARYWERVREQFPGWTAHPPINAAFETFGPPAPRRSRVSFELPSTPGPTRAMFEDADGNQLIQVQPDRFVRNWRRYGDQEAPYPRYATFHRPGFEVALKDYLAFLTEHGVGEMVANQVEVTYVNHIVADGTWKHHGQLGQVLSLYSGRHSDGHLDEAEGVDINVRYRIHDAEEEPVGRLHVSVRPVFKAVDLTPMFAINLTARIGISGGGVADILNEMDRGHGFLVNAFRSITTLRMHKIWGLQHDS